MTRQPFTARYTTLELYLKNVKVLPNEHYTLSLDALGGEMELFFSNIAVVQGRGLHHIPASSEWQTHSFSFTLGNATSEFADWGLCLVKTAWAWHAYGGTYSTTYLDNVRLCADGDTRNLLDGGTFENPVSDAVYDVHWRPSVLGEAGTSLGVDVVTDPLNANNHCLRIPSVITQVSYPHPFPLEAYTFGAFNNIEDDVRCIEIVGRSHPRFLIAERGEITVKCNGTFTVPSGSLVLLPPNVPYRYTYRAGKDVSYRWLSVDGDAFASLAALLKIDDHRPHTVANVSALVSRIDGMLQQPEGLTYSYAIVGHLHLFFDELERNLSPKPLSHKHQNAITTVAERLRRYPETAPGNPELAAECGLSENYFIGLFKKIMGVSPQKYRLQALVDKSTILLKNTELTVQEIAYSLGIDDPLYFSRLFKSLYGQSPQNYRRSSR